MIEIKAPNPVVLRNVRSIFLAGSIEMGAAENWQEKIKEELAPWPNLILLNPRRDDWDSTWIQSKDNPQFRQQVMWELEMQERAKLIVLYLSPGTKSPISLLELGLYHANMVVCCPEGFYRKGNVDLVCERYRTPQVDSLGGLINYIKDWLNMGTP